MIDRKITPDQSNLKMLARGARHIRDVVHGWNCQEEADCIEACVEIRAALKPYNGLKTR